MSNLNQESAKEIARKKLKQFEPKKHLDQTSVKTERELNELQKNFVCDKHGEFALRSNQIFSRIMVNSICPKCVDEFDLIVEAKAKEIESEREDAAQKKRTEKRMEELLVRGVSKRSMGKTFKTYTGDTAGKKNALESCLELSSKIKNDEQPFNLIMVGGVGTGKTHLANSMVIDLFDAKKVCVRINLIDLIRRLKATWSRDSEETETEVIEMFVGVDLLIIDEVGIQFGSDTEKMFVFDIINGRYEECLPTAIISNLDINGVKEIIGERCVDRLREDGGKVVAFDWKSHR